MTLTPQLAQQCLEALEYHVAQTRPIDRTSAAISALREALASGEGDEARDAARYRWLRNESDFLRLKSGSPQVCMTNEWGEIVSLLPSAYPRGETLDAAIDAAMKGNGK